MKRNCKLSTLRDRFWSKVAITANPDRCWEWLASKNRKGYGRIGVEIGSTSAHRAVWFLTHGVWPVLHVLHKCDNPSCVNPNHLWEGTDAENRADMLAKGRSQKAWGERASGAKLKEADVYKIRELLATGATRKSLAREYNVTVKTIEHIEKRQRWSKLS